METNARVLTCVYCGHEYPQDTPAWGNQVLTDHIAQCEKHPMRAVVEERDRLRAALIGLVGASEPDELRAIEAVVRSMPVPDADKAVTVNAIHALLLQANAKYRPKTGRWPVSSTLQARSSRRFPTRNQPVA